MAVEQLLGRYRAGGIDRQHDPSLVPALQCGWHIAEQWGHEFAAGIARSPDASLQILQRGELHITGDQTLQIRHHCFGFRRFSSLSAPQRLRFSVRIIGPCLINGRDQVRDLWLIGIGL